MTERRLNQAEQVARTLTEGLDPQAPLDPVDVGAFGLCNGSALLQTIHRMAESRATRRAMHEGRDPVRGFDPTDFRALVRIEFGDLARLWVATGDLWQPIEAWSDAPDSLGWPTERHYSDRPHPTGFAAFLVWLDLLRVRFDQQRGGSAEGSVRWRAAHPDWHRGMTREESVE